MNVFKHTGVVVLVVLAATGSAVVAQGEDVDSTTVDIAAVWGEVDISFNDDLLEGPPTLMGPDLDFPPGPAYGGCEHIAWPWVYQWWGANRARGDFFEILDRDVTLDEFGLCVEFQTAGDADLWFIIYERAPEEEEYTKIVEKVVRFAGEPGQQECYLSGVISRIGDPGNPVVLFKDYKYILCDAWTNEKTIGFFQDTRQYPQPFSAGLVLGLLTLNSPPPLPDKLLANPYKGGAHWMEVCFAPTEGACCINGACKELLEDECKDREGEFTDERVTCEQVELLGGCKNIPRGACCFDVGCDDDPEHGGLNKHACQVAKGRFQGRQTTCERHCPTGACCLDECEDDYSETYCLSLEGSYRGDGSECPVDPPCWTGACCLPGGCYHGTKESCLEQHGVYRGEGTRCETLDPHCPGTCCDKWGDCQDDVTPQDCAEFFQGEFVGYHVTCRDFDCLDPINTSTACCLEDGRCFDVIGDDAGLRACDRLFGDLRDGELCPPDPPCPTEACCLPDGTCDDTIGSHGCLAAGGKPQGVPNCGGVSCPQPLHACCFFDESCSDLVADDCLAAGGITKAGITCETADCTYPCDKIKKFKAKCKNRKLKALVKSDPGDKLPKGFMLELTLDEADSKWATFNARGKAKTKWKGVQLGEHEVCIDQCPQMCAQTTCN